jgi:hypothetical protein
MSTDLLAESLQQSLVSGGGGDSFLYEEPTEDIAAAVAGEGCVDMVGDGDFVGVSVGDFDLGEEMQLDGFPIDLWPGAMEPSSLAEETLGMLPPPFSLCAAAYFSAILPCGRVISVPVTRGFVYF